MNHTQASPSLRHSLLIQLLLLVAICAAPASIHAEANPRFWNLPADLTDANTTIRFEVDSTWHMVHGKTSAIRGRAWLADPQDYRSIRAEISLPVAQFDTNNSSRDERMREVMHADRSPNVHFALTAVPNICTPEELSTAGSCPATLEGNLTINDVVLPITLPATVEKADQAITVDATSSFAWADFGIEDPSIFIARLRPSVKVIVHINFS